MHGGPLGRWWLRGQATSCSWAGLVMGAVARALRGRRGLAAARRSRSASKTLAREVGASGVRVNVVSPGFTNGAPLDEMFEQMAARGGGAGEELKARAANAAALRRHVDPEDIADACVFLISERGRNITGIELHVNAGQWIG